MKKNNKGRKTPKNAPQYEPGDKVTAVGFEDLINSEDKTLIIESSFWNGFTYMYHFKGSDMGLGEPYLSLVKTPLTLLVIN